MNEPASVNECVYFTRRNDKDGKVVTWVLREKCPQCGKGLIGKPKDTKTGKIKIRSENYVCSECKYELEKEEYESGLTANIKYECSCGHKGELQLPFKRKKVMKFDEEKQKKVSVEALLFECEGCKKKFYVTKKMK